MYDSLISYDRMKYEIIWNGVWLWKIDTNECWNFGNEIFPKPSGWATEPIDSTNNVDRPIMTQRPTNLIYPLQNEFWIFCERKINKVAW
jgi:hypothetical protein